MAEDPGEGVLEVGLDPGFDTNSGPAARGHQIWEGPLKTHNLVDRRST
jgi:hypothetical protein